MMDRVEKMLALLNGCDVRGCTVDRLAALGFGADVVNAAGRAGMIAVDVVRMSNPAGLTVKWIRRESDAR